MAICGRGSRCSVATFCSPYSSVDSDSSSEIVFCLLGIANRIATCFSDAEKVEVICSSSEVGWIRISEDLYRHTITSTARARATTAPAASRYQFRLQKANISPVPLSGLKSINILCGILSVFCVCNERRECASIKISTLSQMNTPRVPANCRT